YPGIASKSSQLSSSYSTRMRVTRVVAGNEVVMDVLSWVGADDSREPHYHGSRVFLAASTIKLDDGVLRGRSIAARKVRLVVTRKQSRLSILTVDGHHFSNDVR